eukprot:9771609-Karenia_brevis.AAC.1
MAMETDLTAKDFQDLRNFFTGAYAHGSESGSAEMRETWCTEDVVVNCEMLLNPVVIQENG